MHPLRLVLLAFIATAVVTSCGSTSADDASAPPAQTTGAEPPTTATTDPAGGDSAEILFPDVVDATATQAEDGTWTFAVTLSSPYDSPDRYADSWRVRSADAATVYGERFLSHDHAGEQPFTRSQSGIEIPDDVTMVVVEGRDQVSGWGGTTLTLSLEP